jgi:hypothetical protein
MNILAVLEQIMWRLLDSPHIKENLAAFMKQNICGLLIIALFGMAVIVWLLIQDDSNNS